MKTTRFGCESKLNYSRAGLWWRYINYSAEGGLGGGCLVVFGLTFLAVLLLIVVLVVIHEVPFWIDGQQTTATVNDKSQHTERGHKGQRRTVHAVSYDFRDAAGNLQQGQGAIDGDPWNRIHVGDRLTITYLTSNPRHNRPDRDFMFFPIILFGVILLFSAGTVYGGIAIVVNGIRALARKVRLIETGEATAAIVDALVPVVGRRTGGAVNCSYHYLIPARTGAPSQIERSTIRLTRWEARRIRAGELLLVVFNPEQPDDHAVDIHRARCEEPEAIPRQ